MFTNRPDTQNEELQLPRGRNNHTVDAIETNPVKTVHREVNFTAKNYHLLYEEVIKQQNSAEEVIKQKAPAKSTLGNIATDANYYFIEEASNPLAIRFLKAFWSNPSNVEATKKAALEKYIKKGIPSNPSCISFTLLKIEDENMHCVISLSSAQVQSKELLEKLHACCIDLNYDLTPRSDNELKSGTIEYQFVKKDGCNKFVVRFLDKDNEIQYVHIPAEKLIELSSNFPTNPENLQANKNAALQTVLTYLSNEGFAPRIKGWINFHLLTGNTQNFNKLIAKINLNLPNAVQIPNEKLLKNQLTKDEGKACSEKFLSSLLVKLYSLYGKDIFVEGTSNYEFYPINMSQIKLYGTKKRYELLEKKEETLSMIEGKIYLANKNGKISYSMITKDNKEVIDIRTALNWPDKNPNGTQLHDDIEKIALRNGHAKLNLIDSDAYSHMVKMPVARFKPDDTFKIDDNLSFVSKSCCKECKTNKAAVMMTLKTAQDSAANKTMEEREKNTTSPLRNSFYRADTLLFTPTIKVNESRDQTPKRANMRPQISK